MGLLDKIFKTPGGTLAVNPDPVVCPKCSEPMPRVRKPTSFRQAMKGGWTCPKCGAEMDRWGKLLAE